MRQKPPDCNKCPYKNIGIGFVHGYGPVSPRFVACAQAPGRDEIRAEEPQPLVGASGKIFNRVLYDQKVKRSDVYLTNVIKCMPPEDQLPEGDLLEQTVSYCTKTYLEKELQVVEGNVLALGGLAFKHFSGASLTNKKDGMSIFKYRGYPFWSKRYNRHVIPTIHPALIFKTKTATSDSAPAGAIIPALQNDVAKIARFTNVVEPELILDPTEGDVGDYVRECLDSGGIIAADIESVGYEKDEDDVFRADQQMTMIGLSYKPNQAIVVLPEHFHLLTPVFHQLRQVGHNYLSDLLSLSKRYMFEVDVSKIEDTMCAFHACYSDLPKRLGVVGSFYTNYMYWKDLYKTDMQRYNGYDAAGTLLCWQGLQKELDKWQTWEPYRTMVELYPFAQQSYELGVTTDPIKAQRIQLKLIERRKYMINVLQQKFPMINFDSSKQLIEFLYDIMKLPKQYNKQGKLSGDKECLEKLYKQTGSQVVKAIQLMKEGKKVIDYLDEATGGNLHYSLRITATSTGRMEAKQPNVMQQPDETRIVYIADKECQ